MPPKTKPKESTEFEVYFLRKLTKSGNARYLSIGTILPKDWQAVKVYVDSLSPEGCTLKIIPIR